MNIFSYGSPSTLTLALTCLEKVEKGKGKGISISVMNVNVKKWHVKSSMLDKNIIEYYYKNINPVALNMNYDSKRAPSESRPKKRRHHRRTTV